MHGSFDQKLFLSLMITGLFFGQVSENRSAEHPFTIELHLSAREIVSYEPLLAVVSLRNNSIRKRGVNKDIIYRTKFYVEATDGSNREIWTVRCRGAAIDKLVTMRKKGSTYDWSALLYLYPCPTTTEPKFVFPKSGKYRVFATIDDPPFRPDEREVLRSTSFEVNVASSHKVGDIAAQKIFSDFDVANEIQFEPFDLSETTIEKLINLLKNHPENSCADYAHYVLGQYYWRKGVHPKYDYASRELSADHLLGVSDRSVLLRKLAAYRTLEFLRQLAKNNLPTHLVFGYRPLFGFE